MAALDTWGFAQKQRPSPRCGSRWDQLRCLTDELLSPGGACIGTLSYCDP